jgi:hypothetical protein
MVVNATLLSSWTLGAWCSLLWVALTDIYILLVSSGMEPCVAGLYTENFTI